jgi:hypothetical protein
MLSRSSLRSDRHMAVGGAPQGGAAGEGSGKGRAGRARLLSWSRPESYWEVVVAHLPLAMVTGIALMLPHAVSCDDLPLIPCTFLTLTGYPCPFCGLTRSFWAIAHGDWAFALHNAPMSCLIYVGTALLFSWHLTALITGLRIRSSLFRLLTSPLFLWLMVSLAISNWAYRLFRGLE